MPKKGEPESRGFEKVIVHNKALKFQRFRGFFHKRIEDNERSCHTEAMFREVHGMKILNEKIDKTDLQRIESVMFFDEMCMVKAVVDISQQLVAVNAELHADLEQLLLENGSAQSSLYGINIYYDTGEIEFDSLINPPRNREAGYPRVGRYVADPEARKKIEEVVRKWIQL